MWKLIWVDENKIIKNSFKEAKNEVLELQSQIKTLEEEIHRLQNALIDFHEKAQNKAINEEKDESQSSLSIENLRIELRNLIQEEVGKSFKELNSQAADVFSEDSQPENSENLVSETPLVQEMPVAIQKSEKQRTKDNLKADLIKNYERNRKDIIKQQILSEAIKEDVSKIRLRDIVVDQKKYCSKASFYRYMEELELQGLISYQRKKGKDIIITSMH